MQKLQKQLIQKLEEKYPEVKCALDYRDARELSVAVMLSAQCTDARVNKVTPKLFEECKSWDDFSSIPIQNLEKLVFSTGFYKNKAKNIQALGEIIVEKYRGELPRSMPELVALPGIGRKTANVIQQEAFGIVEGLVVDTHCIRNSYRLGFGKNTKNAEIQERNLMKSVPKKYWYYFTHWMILIGRSECVSRIPKCSQCFLNDICPKKGVKKSA